MSHGAWQETFPMGTDGPHTGFAAPCHCCKLQQEFVYVGLKKKSDGYYHVYGCPKDKCQGRIEVKQRRK